MSDGCELRGSHRQNPHPADLQRVSLAASVGTGALARPSRAQLGYCACPGRDFFKGVTSAFSSTNFSTATREKPRRDDKSDGPWIDPECFMNLGMELFFFAITLNPFASQALS
jgi:hypothetical protein